MIKKITVVVLVGIIVAGLIALMWWWFFNRAPAVPTKTASFGTAQNIQGSNGNTGVPPANIGSDTIGSNNTHRGQNPQNKMTSGKYTFQTQNGAKIGTYQINTNPTNGSFDITPTDGSPPLQTGSYVLSVDGVTTGDYVVTSLFGSGGSSSTYNINPTTLIGGDPVFEPSTGVDLLLGSSGGSVFNATPANHINTANPSGGLLPNIGGGTGGTGTQGSGLAGALAGAAIAGGITCGAQFAFATMESTAGASAGAAAPAAGAAAGTALEAAETVKSVSTVNDGLTLAIVGAIAGLGGVAGEHAGDDKAQNTTDSFWGCLTRTVGKIALQQITSSVVNWINSGFNGSPSFVTNPTQFFSNVADNAAGAYIKGSGLSFLCSPFSLQIKIAIAKSYANRNAQSCTLTGITKNVNNFMNGNFSAGGWGQFLSFTTVPTNNPYGAYAMASIGLQANVDKALSQKQSDLNQGRGFLSLQKAQNCQEPTATAPAGITVSQTTQSFTNLSTVDTNGTIDPGGFVVLGAGIGAGQKQTVRTTESSDGSGATMYSVCDLVNTTPGSVIAGTIDKALGVSQDSLNLAKSFDEIISALITQLTTRTLQSGLSNISGANGYQSNFYTPDQLAAQTAGQALILHMQNDNQIVQSYAGVQQGSIGDIQNVQSAVNDLYNCWNNAAQNVKANSAAITQNGGRPDTLLARANAGADAASTTLGQLQTQVNGYNEVITNANKSTALFEGFESRALSAASSQDTASITQDYNTMKASGQTFSTADLTTAQQNRTTLQSQLQTLSQQTSAGLQQCNAFH